MRKLIAAINQTIDGYCDHTYGIPDEEIHDHYANLLSSADEILYGRVTYQLMEDFWPTLVANPSGTPSMDNFAAAIDKIQKIVFSKSITSLSWKNSILATEELEQAVLHMKQQTGKDFYVGSPSLISQLTALNLIDEFQLCIHPVIAGTGRKLFQHMSEPSQLRLVNTKLFKSGAVIHYYSR